MSLIILLLVVSVSMATRRQPPQPHEPVIIVGGGLAGLSAALEALDHGSKVVIIDAEKNTGGNSAKASSGINAYGTRAQEKLGIQDSGPRFVYDTLQAGDRENDESLVDVLVHRSTDAIGFLERFGIDLGDVNLCGGHSVPRTHWVPSPKEGRPIPVGFEIMKKLREALNKHAEKNPGSVEFHTETRVQGLNSWNAYITGVNAKLPNGTNVEYSGKAVILATGGFSADHNEDSLLTEFAPDAAKFPTTNGPFAQGDGLKMARAMGAEIVGMKRVQIHPTAFVDPSNPSDNTKFLAAEALRGKGAILINKDGSRFADELGRRDYLTTKIINAGRPIEKFQNGSGGRAAAIMLMSKEVVQSFGEPAFNFYYKVKKFFKLYDNFKHLANELGAPLSTLEETVMSYNEFVGGDKKQDAFGKTVFPVAFNPSEPVYAAIVTPAIHYTMGGLKIDTQARVKNAHQQSAFDGLFAAGEVAGGVHGSNRLAGNSLLECVVFGRIAGRSAAEVNYGHAEL